MPKNKFRSSKIKLQRYICKYCEQLYTQKGTLNRHIKNNHTKFKGKPCKYCGKETKRFKDHEQRCELKFLKNKLNQNYIAPNNSYNDKSSDNDSTCNIPKETQKKLEDNLETRILFDNIIKSLSKYNKIESISGFNLYKNVKIAEGGTMKIFYGTTKNYEKKVAIKIPKKKKSLIREIFILNYLKNIPGIPKIYFYVSTKSKNFLIEDLFGPSLRTILYFQKQSFDLFTICEIGIQIISILQEMHDNNIVHNDIKPENICWGKMEKGCLIHKDKVYLIDFGYSRKLDFDTKNDNEMKKCIFAKKGFDFSIKKNRYEGTPKYMGVKKAFGSEPTKQSDLEELLYCLIFLYKGNLPWDNLDVEDHVKRCEEMNKIKSITKISELCKGLPEEFTVIAYYILNLSEKDRPCYDTIINLLKLAKEKENPPYNKTLKFSFRKNIIEKFNRYKNKLNDKIIEEEIKILFGSIPVNKTSLLD